MNSKCITFVNEIIFNKFIYFLKLVGGGGGGGGIFERNPRDIKIIYIYIIILIIL